MTDEHKLAAAITRSAQAEALLQNTMLQEAFTGLREAYMKAWQGTAALDTQSREVLWVAYNGIGKVEEHLRFHIRNGRLAQAEIDELVKMRERAMGE